MVKYLVKARPARSIGACPLAGKYAGVFIGKINRIPQQAFLNRPQPEHASKDAGEFISMLGGLYTGCASRRRAGAG
jgi:hypothetical protein